MEAGSYCYFRPSIQISGLVSIMYLSSATLCHLVLGQQFASPVGVRNVVDGQAQVVVAVFEEQRLGILQQNSTETPFQIQHFLRRGGEEKTGSETHLFDQIYLWVYNSNTFESILSKALN